MFSSDNNNYPLFYNQSPSFLTNESYNNNIFFQHYYGKFLPPTNSSLSSSYLPIISENSIGNLSSEPSINQQNTTSILFPSDNNNYNNNNVRNGVSSSRRVGGKKDSHTKITTAQGVRDRRVRLSMSIAREFFNLQDMLGFDKASKTLGWLLSKSKPSIDELASNFKSSEENEEEVQHHTDHNKNNDNNCYYNNNNNNNIDDEVEKSLSPSKKRNRRENNHLINNNNNNSTRNVVDELRRREEARERARERTRKKKIVDDQQRGVHHNNEQDLMICHSNPGIMSNNGLIGKEGGISTVRESVVIKGNYNKSRGSSYNSNFNNYEMISSKDEQDYYNYDYFSSSGIMQPNGFPALNVINLSTEIHINARPWDAYSNHILH